MTSGRHSLPSTGAVGRHRLSLRLLLVLAIAAGIAVGTAVAASAHATLLSATPGDGVVVAQSPAEISLRYDQPVSTALGAVRVLDPGGTRVDTGAVSQREDGAVVVAALRPHLGNGTYTVLWRVLSADSHTIFGASTFSVGRASSTSVAGLEAEQESAGAAARIGLDVSRGVLYAGLALLVGVLFFAWVLWPAGLRVRGVRRLLRGGWWATVGATVAGVLLQGPYAAGRPLTTAFDPDVLAQVLGTRFGMAALARLALLAGIGLGLRRVLRSAPSRSLLWPLAGATLAVVATISLVGHAGSSALAALATPIDMAHILAASVWLGGLAVLATVLLRPRTTEIDVSETDFARVMTNWSRTALTAVAVLVASGVFAGWRQIREWGALTGTDYGRLLLVKVALVLVVVAIGGLGHRLVRTRWTAPVAAPEPRPAGTGSTPGGATLVATRPPVTVDRTRPARRLRIQVLVETVLAVGVLGVTSVLVGSTPARDSYFPDFSASAAVTADLSVAVSVPAVRVGLNELVLVYSGPGGRPTDVIATTGRWTQRTGGDNVVPVTPTRSGPGRYSVTGLALPAAGDWQLAVTTQTSDIDSSTELFDVRVR